MVFFVDVEADEVVFVVVVFEVYLDGVEEGDGPFELEELLHAGLEVWKGFFCFSEGEVSFHRSRSSCKLLIVLLSSEDLNLCFGGAKVFYRLGCVSGDDKV